MTTSTRTPGTTAPGSTSRSSSRPGPSTQRFDYDGKYYQIKDFRRRHLPGPTAAAADLLRRVVCRGLRRRCRRVRHLCALGRAVGRHQGADRVHRCRRRRGRRRRGRPCRWPSGRSSRRPRNWPGRRPRTFSGASRTTRAGRPHLPPQRQPGECRLTATARRGGRRRAARPGAVDGADRTDRRWRQFDRSGRHPGDGRRGAAGLLRPRRPDPVRSRVRHPRRRHRFRPVRHSDSCVPKSPAAIPQAPQPDDPRSIGHSDRLATNSRRRDHEYVIVRRPADRLAGTGMPIASGTWPRPHGWLSLTSFHWLPVAPTALPGLPGALLRAGRTGRAAGQCADGYADRRRVRGARRRNSPSHRRGGEVVGVARRWAMSSSNWPCVAVDTAIRTRDPQAITRVAFPVCRRSTSTTSGWWTADSRRSTHPDGSRSVRRGTTWCSRSRASARSRSALEGRSYSLIATAGAAGTFNIAFHDTTNGGRRPLARRVATSVPDSDGRVEIDFNRAINFAVRLHRLRHLSGTPGRQYPSGCSHLGRTGSAGVGDGEVLHVQRSSTIRRQPARRDRRLRRCGRRHPDEVWA